MTTQAELGNGYRFYSFATAAHNKKLGDPVCEVILLDMSNFLDGELSDRGEAAGFDYEDAAGNKKSSKEVSSQSVPATWHCFEGNRITPPDVRRDEQLIIYTYADTGKLFWTPRNTNRHTRKLETVTWAFSGTTDEGDGAITSDNHYLVEVSTHQGHLSISTTDKNKEVCKWFVQIRGKDGKFIVADDQGQEVLIDSVEHIIRAINADETYVELNKKDINVTAVKHMNVNVGGNTTVNVKGSATVNVKGKATMTAGSYSLTAAVMTFNGESVFNGPMTLNGAFQGNGVGEFTGHLKLPGGHSPPD